MFRFIPRLMSSFARFYFVTKAKLAVVLQTDKHNVTDSPINHLFVSSRPQNTLG